MLASKLFFKPNWRGVNRKLNTKLSIKGKAIIQLISCLKVFKKTEPKDTAIMA
jgi:hypothetical protein